MVAIVLMSGTVIADEVGGPEGRTMEEQPIITISDAAFPRRFANLLVDTRRRRDLSVGDIVRLSEQRLSRAQVKAIEEATLPLTEEIVETACQVYGADLAVILPHRLPVVVDAGILTTGGVVRDFDPADPDSLLTAYLSMVRELRHQEKAPVVDLRRSDLDVLADYLQQPGEHVLDRLMTLMGATRARRISVAVLFASGAAVIGLVGGAAALSLGGGDGGDGVDGDTVPSETSIAVVATTQSVDASTTVTVETVAPTTVVATSPPTTTVAPPITSPPATATTVATAPPPTTVVAVAPPPTLPPTAPPTTDPGEPLPTAAPTTTIVEVGQPPLPPTVPDEPLPTAAPVTTIVDVGEPPLPPSTPAPLPTTEP